MYHAIKWAESSEVAYQLGIESIRDRSKKVRNRGCMLLTVAQQKVAIGPLFELLDDPNSSDDARAAIDALENGNQNYFLDRDYTGKVSLNVATFS